MPAKNTKAASAVASKAAPEDENVFLFIPNLIGYSRIILAAGSLYYMPEHPKTCMIMYSISCLLDAVDGMAARYYGQCKPALCTAIAVLMHTRLAHKAFAAT
ncbi:hypothetical protein EDD21DRAFT_152457 [Dissophora ornata]|nr:hypothetical protein EDD21DRAFT_152457 [Dissophora ornata]